jgi:hypothetical protein
LTTEATRGASGLIWARGPCEVFRHADEHLRLGSYFDRRMALVGFDNAIEIAIDVYVSLPPELRGRISLPRNEVEALRSSSFQEKIRWLFDFVNSHDIPLAVSRDELVFFHSKRNIIYHSGNGLTPDPFIVDNARRVAREVLVALYGEDAVAQHTKPPLADPGVDPEQQRLADADAADFRFLRQWIDFESMLGNYADLQLTKAFHAGKRIRSNQVSPARLWKRYGAPLMGLKGAWSEEVVKEAWAARNQVLEGDDIVSARIDLKKLGSELMELLTILGTAWRAHEAEEASGKTRKRDRMGTKKGPVPRSSTANKKGGRA